MAQTSQELTVLKKEQEKVKEELDSLLLWKFRVKVTEKTFYFSLLCVAFWFYKAPSTFYFLLNEYPHYLISGLCLGVIIF